MAMSAITLIIAIAVQILPAILKAFPTLKQTSVNYHTKGSTRSLAYELTSPNSLTKVLAIFADFAIALAPLTT